MSTFNSSVGFHDEKLYTGSAASMPFAPVKAFAYTFENFFHPFVGELVEKLERESLPGMLDAAWQEKDLKTPEPSTNPAGDFFHRLYDPVSSKLVQVKSFAKKIDVSPHGSYASYNWELFFHVPLTIAVHLSKSQRFAEAQRWFHYIFDPTSHDSTVEAPAKRFWKFIAFRQAHADITIDEVLRLLGAPAYKLSAGDQELQKVVLEGYDAIRSKPFQPHVVARTRHIAYQYCVVMKYLDNLIAWGDNLFRQDTVESITEATQLYLLATNVLGHRPQRVPLRGKTQAKTFAQLKEETGLGAMGNAMVALEAQFPFNFATPGAKSSDDSGARAFFGMGGPTLYFCNPRNDKLLGYWDTVGDRLFKIRHCMNMEGLVRPRALFDPPIDPGMLVKAAAAGIDIGGIVNGLNQPIGPVRCQILIQRALELCGEVRNLGAALLSTFEKGDAEHLSLLRQKHEVRIEQMMQDTRFLQWKQAQEATASLLTTRATALERLHYYQRLLGLPSDENASDKLTLDQRELTEENFDEAYANLVGQYDKTLKLQEFPELKLAGETSSPGGGIGGMASADGSGRLYLNSNENADLNSHSPRARDTGLLASSMNAIAAGLVPVPDAKANFHFWGIGGTADLKVGTALVAAAKIAGDIFGIVAAWEREQAAMASKTASYQRRTDEWILQHNLAAHELMQTGRQILTSLITEQIAHHEYVSTQQQIANSQEVDRVLHEKFTNQDLYLWMQGEISRLYYEYYRFAFDAARRAERTMKHEVMRPELDAQDFVKFNYWDGGRKGLLSGEALHLGVKRMEMAYLDHNKRELELTRHVSLRQLNPLALLTLKVTGSCTFVVPEWLYDRDCPGHYMRRIKSVALSIPSVVGPYTSVNCTLSLLKSSVRKSPIAGDYLRQGFDDDRFVDYIGAVQSIVTSGANNDSGLFEANLRDERFLPFEGAGVESTWKLDLPGDYRAFDYATISDVVLHVRYTARQGVEPGKVKIALESIFQKASQSNLALLFSLSHDFPTEWSAFINAKGKSNFAVKIRKDHFPYFTQGEAVITIDMFELYDASDLKKHPWMGASLEPIVLTNTASPFSLKLGPDGPGPVLKATDQAEMFLIIRYSLS